MSVEKNRLSRKEVGLAYDWFKDNIETVRLRGLAQEEVARMMTKELGFLVTRGNVEGIAGSGARAMIEFQWPGSRRSKSSGSHHIKILYRMVEAIRKDQDITSDVLGEPLVQEWDKMRDELGLTL